MVPTKQNFIVAMIFLGAQKKRKVSEKQHFATKVKISDDCMEVSQLIRDQKNCCSLAFTIIFHQTNGSHVLLRSRYEILPNFNGAFFSSDFCQLSDYF